MENDIKNWNKFKFNKDKLALKKGVIPHRFECQQRMEPPTTSSVVLKQKRQGIIQDLVKNIKKEISLGNDIIHEKPMKIDEVKVESTSEIASEEIMEIDEIKVEDSSDESAVCTVCLSMERKLASLGEYEGVFRKIVADTLFKIPVAHVRDIIICWECRALLKKATEFEVKFQKACEYFVFSQPYLHSLSNLETVILSDDQPSSVYIDETKNIIDVNIEVKIEENCDEEVYSEEIFSEEMFVNDDFKPEISEIDNSKIEISKTNDVDSGKEIKKKNTVKKTKSKFRLIRKYEEAVRRVQLDEDAVNKCMERERDSEYYKSFKYKCEDCILGFPDVIMFEDHIGQCHKNEGIFVCNKCKRSFFDELLYAAHTHSHTCKYVCDVCLYESCHREVVLKHVHTHRVIYQCSGCPLKYGDRRELYKHYKDWHEKYICAECGATYRFRHSLENHLKTNHSPRVCDECGATFMLKSSLYNHRSKKHAKFPRLMVKRPYNPTKAPCPLCDKIFSKKVYMINHYNYEHLKSDKFTCDICQKRCLTNADLKKHKRRIHEGVKAKRNKMCNVCGKRFYTTKILEHHLLTHSGERPHSCHLCPSSFTQLVAARAHFKAKHKHVDIAIFDELVKKRREENVA